jgi:hypothetical protein
MEQRLEKLKYFNIDVRIRDFKKKYEKIHKEKIIQILRKKRLHNKDY